MSENTVEKMEKFTTGAAAKLQEIEHDWQSITEVRNRFIRGSASREEVFEALNTAARNMVIYLGVYEQSVTTVISMTAVTCQGLDEDHLLARLTNRDREKKADGMSTVQMARIIPIKPLVKKEEVNKTRKSQRI